MDSLMLRFMYESFAALIQMSAGSILAFVVLISIASTVMQLFNRKPAIV